MPRKRSGKRPVASAGAAQKGQVRIIGGEWRGEPYPVGPDGLATPLFVGNRRFAVARLPTRWDGQPPSASADPVRLPSPYRTVTSHGAPRRCRECPVTVRRFVPMDTAAIGAMQNVAQCVT